MSRDMTDSEAIANLNHIYGFLSPNIQRSLDVAFKALEDVKRLEDENHQNFVNSQHIISSLIEENKELNDNKEDAETQSLGAELHGIKIGYEEAQKKLIQQQGEWIPISERLPNDRDWYLGVFREPDTGFIGLPYICDYIGVVTKGTTKEGWILRGFTDIDYADDYIKSLECVAWQPLPEPYKKGGAE